MILTEHLLWNKFLEQIFCGGGGSIQGLSEMTNLCSKNDRFQDNNTHTRISPAQGFCEGYFLERLMLLDR
jgi:hypothetical protein